MTTEYKGYIIFKTEYGFRVKQNAYGIHDGHLMTIGCAERFIDALLTGLTPKEALKNLRKV